MTYEDLLKKTEARKKKALKDISTALRGPAGFLAKAELEKDPGTIAYLWLAEDFCKELADHICEWMEAAEAEGRSWEAQELAGVYMAYEDDDPDLYQLLPVEAQLFTK